MDILDIRLLSTAVFTAIFGVFGIYHLISFLVLRHKILLYYFILILGLTLHWSLYFFLDYPFDNEFSLVVEKVSLTTAMLTTLGLLLFTRSYLNIGKPSHPKLWGTYAIFIWIVLCLPVVHVANKLTYRVVWLNDVFVLTGAIMAMSSIVLNIFSGIHLFKAHKLNRYYLYAYAPILVAAILYIGTWFLKRYFSFDASLIVLMSSVLVTVQLMLFSLLIGYKFKALEDEHMKMQVDANKILQEEVDRQTMSLQKAKRDLEKQNDELEKVNKLKNKMFSLLTHDVRAPLNNFVAIIELIETGLVDEELMHMTKKIKGEITDRISMVNDLLQWSYYQLDGIILNKKMCPLENVFVSIKHEFDRVAAEKEIVIEINAEHPKLFIDESMLKVVLRNLVSNAIKFSKKGQKINLWSKLHSNGIELGVQDFGMGMDSDWFKNLKSNERPGSRRGTEGEKGTGFGLIISKDFVEMNGGEMICESEVNKGTSFILSFKKAV